jgi:hypothetical protein
VAWNKPILQDREIRLSRNDKDPTKRIIDGDMIRNSPCQSSVLEYSFTYEECKMLDPGWSEAVRLIGG